MSTVPKGRADRLGYYESHVNRWVENAESLQLDAELAAALQSKTIEVRQAFTQQRQAQLAARSATARFNQAMREMRKLGSCALKQIHVAATKVGNEAYSLASISPRKKKSPIAPPGRPFKFETVLLQIGWLKLAWKCKNPKRAEGTMYHIYRRIGPSGPLVLLGESGKKNFIDKTLPRGAAMVIYQIQALRTTSSGEVATFTVNFGTGNAVRMGPAVPTKRCA